MAWIYFVVLIVLGSFFAVNLALAVLYLQFLQSQADSNSSDDDRLWESTEVAPPEGQDCLHTGAAGYAGALWARMRLLCYNVQQHKWFEHLTMTLIAVNTIVMASEHYGMSPLHAQVCMMLWLRQFCRLQASECVGSFT